MANAHGGLTITRASDTEIIMTRAFNAPRELVFEAWIKPEHVKRWWGRRGSTMVTCEMDARPGGAWRFVLREADGNEYPFKGVYREINSPERLAYTFIYDVAPFSDHEAVETLDFTEQNGGTLISCSTIYDSKESCDAMMGSGMDEGSREFYDVLEEYLEALISKK